MITLRRAEARGHADYGWLDTRHTFSFADYHDPAHMGFRNLRVINEDRVAPGQGFGTHPHRDMEIISYVLSGGLSHRDSMGNGSIILPGEVQRMSAGSGITHSEANASDSETVHFLQIWILPTKKGITPGYEQKTFFLAQNPGQLCLLASPDGRDGSVTINADATLRAGIFHAGQACELAIPSRRHAYVHVARGTIRLGPHDLSAGDGAAISDQHTTSLEGVDAGEVLVFELA